MSKLNIKLLLSSEENPVTGQFYDPNGKHIQDESDFDDAEQKLRQISESFPEQQSFADLSLEEAEIDLILQSEDSSIEADLNNWLRNEDLHALDVEGSHNETITATVIQDNYEVDRTRVLRVAMSGFFTLFILSLLGASLLFFDLQSQVDETRGSLHSLRTQLFGEHYAPATRENSSPLLEPLLTAGLSDNQHSEEVRVLQQNLDTVTDKVSSLEKLLKELPVTKSDSSEGEKLSAQDKVTSEHNPAVIEPLTLSANSKQWTVFLVSLPDTVQLDKRYKKFRRFGVATERQQVTVNGKQWHRLYVTGFSSKEAAGTFAGKATRLLGLKGVWVAKLS